MLFQAKIFPVSLKIQKQLLIDINKERFKDLNQIYHDAKIGKSIFRFIFNKRMFVTILC